MNEELLLGLWEDGNEYFELPDFETFKVDMQDEDRLRGFRDDMSEYFELPDFETFKVDINFDTGIRGGVTSTGGGFKSIKLKTPDEIATETIDRITTIIPDQTKTIEQARIDSNFYDRPKDKVVTQDMGLVSIYDPVYQAENKPYNNKIEVLEEFVDVIKGVNKVYYPNLTDDKLLEVFMSYVPENKSGRKVEDGSTWMTEVYRSSTIPGGYRIQPTQEFKDIFGENTTMEDVHRVRKEIIFFQDKFHDQDLKDKKKLLEEAKKFDPTTPVTVTEDVELEETPIVDYLTNLAKDYDEADGFLSNIVSGVAEFLIEEREGMDMSLAKRADIQVDLLEKQKADIDNFEPTAKKLIEIYVEPEEGVDREEQIDQVFNNLVNRENTDNPLNSILVKAQTPEGALEVMEETGFTLEELNDFQKTYTAIQIGKEKARQKEKYVNHHLKELDRLTFTTPESAMFDLGTQYQDQKQIYVNKLRNLNMNDPEWREKFFDEDVKNAIFKTTHAKGQTEEKFAEDWEGFLNAWGINIYATAGESADYNWFYDERRDNMARLSNAVTISSKNGPDLVLYTNHTGKFADEFARTTMDKLFNYVKDYGSFVPPMTPDELLNSNLSPFTKNLINTDWQREQIKQSQLALEEINNKEKEFTKIRQNFENELTKKINTFSEEVKNTAIVEGWTSKQYEQEVNNFNQQIQQEYKQFSDWYSTQADMSNLKAANELLINSNSIKVIEGVNDMLSNYGTWESIVVDKFVSGVDKMVDGAFEYGIALSGYVGNYGGALDAFMPGTSTDEKIKFMREVYNKNMRSPFSRVIGTGASDTEYGRALMDDWLYGDLLSLVENAPAMLASIATGGLGGGFLLSSTPFALYHTAHMMEEIDNAVDQDGNHYLANMPEWKKWSVILPTVATVSALEKFGVDRITPGKGWIVNSLMMKVLKKNQGKFASKAILPGLVAEELDNWIARGVVRVVDGALVEGVTEGTQQLVEVSFKEMFEALEEIGMKSKPIFDEDGKVVGYQEPNIWSTAMDQGAQEVVIDILTAMRAGAIGGGGYSIIGHVANGNQTYSFGKDTDLLAFEYAKAMIRNKNSLKSLEEMLEAQAANGKLTPKELEENKRALAIAGGVFKQMEAGLDGVDQKIAYDLILEKQDLKNTIEQKGKDNAAWEVQRVKEIEAELSEISIYAKENSTDIGTLRSISKLLTGRVQSNLSNKQIETIKEILEGRSMLDRKMDTQDVVRFSTELSKIEEQLIKENNTAAAREIAQLNNAVNNVATGADIFMNQDMALKTLVEIQSQKQAANESRLKGVKNQNVSDQSYFIVNNKLVSQREFEKLLEDKEFIEAVSKGEASYTVLGASQNIKNKIQESELLSPDKVTEERIEMMEEITPTGKIQSTDTSTDFYETAEKEGIKLSQKDIEEGTAPTAVITPEGDIIIDKQRAREVNDVSAVGHEVFHRLLAAKWKIEKFDTWKNKKENRKKSLKEFQKERNNLEKQEKKAIRQFKQILEKRQKQAFDTIKKRIKTEYVDAGILTEEQAEYSDEWATAFFDLVASGELDASNEGFWVSVGDWIREVLFKPFGYNNLNFKSGRQVYNFAKDYGAQYKRGELGKKTKQAITEAFDKDLVVEKEEYSKKVSESNKAIADRNTSIEEKIIEAGDVRVRDIKDADLQQQIKDELYENNKKAAEVLAGRAAKSAGAMALDPSKRVSEAEFKSGYDEQLGRLIDTYRPVVDGKRIPFGAYMQRNLKRRYNQILQQAKRGKFEGKEQRIGEVVGEGQREFDIASTDPTPEERLISKESQDKKDRVTPRAKLIRDFPEIFDQELKEDFETAGLEIFESPTPEVEGKEFKRFVTEAFRGKTTAKVKKKLGAGKTYEFNVKKLAAKLKENLPIQWFVRMEGSTPVNEKKFTSPPKRLTKQTDIDKAMLDDKVYVEVTSQGVNIYEFKDFTAKELADFILAPLVNPTTGKKSGTRGTRKTGLAEGLVDLFGRQVSPTAIEKVKRKGVKEKLPQISKKLQVDPRTKFTRQKSKTIRFNNKIEQGILDNAIEQRVYENYISDQRFWSKFSREMGGKNYDFNDPKQLEEWKEKEFPKLVKIFPKDFLINSGAFYGYRGFPFKDTNPKKNKQGKLQANHKQAFIDYLNEKFEDSDYGPPFEFEKEVNGKKVKFDPLPIALKKHGTKGKLGLSDKFNAYFGSKENIENNNIKDRVLKEIFLRIQNADGNIIPAAVGMLRTTAAEQAHFMRKIAPITFRELGMQSLTSGQITEEHALGASLTAKQGLFLAYEKVVDDNFTGIQLNYFQGPLSEINDDKVNIKELGMKEGPQKEDLYNVLMGVESGWIRYAKAGIDLNTIEILDENGNKIILTDYYGVKPPKGTKITPEIIELQNSLIIAQIKENITKKEATKEFTRQLPLAKLKYKASRSNIKSLDGSGVVKMSKSLPNSEILREAGIMDKALNIARDPNAPVKKIRVFDFDDTLAQTKSNVLYTMPDGKKGKLTAEEFAKRGTEMLEQGAEFDFSEFNKVMEGKKGPLFEVAKKIQDARGTEDVFVLTARAMEAAPAIKEFLDSIGLEIPLKNITGLGDSSPLAKSGWIVDKAADGYNDFYFADDHMANVNAVKKVLDVIDVKSKVQQAKVKFSKNVDKDFNKIIEQKTGVDWYKEYSAARAQTMGAGKGKFKFLIPPSAEDFTGLLYRFLGKGKVGDAQMAWFKEHLLNPYARGMNDLSTDRVTMMNDFNALKKELIKSGSIPKNLKKKAIDNFTYEDVARVMAWDQQGIEVADLSKRDMAEFRKFMEDNPGLQVFVDQLIAINKGDGYAYPGKNWLAGSITTDLVEGLNTNKRDKYLEQWRENVDLIFSEKNLNKIEALFGTRYREALEDSIRRMKSGKNRTSTGNRLENRLLDYINNSVGTVMFLNMRSGVLQTISAINFLNWGDNNPLRAGRAFANQKQYWSDFMTLMNSDFLVDRRKGLKINVAESEIFEAARNEKNKARAVVNYLLKKGFTVTQIMDSFAIASGGATFYRNRIKSLMKGGMSKEEAEAQAFQDFRETAEESQQSARPDKISQQQASGLGRVILAFANTPMQYNRIIKKATLDLINGRGDYKANLSKIVYYGMVQNLLFTALQQAIFAMGFGDDEEEEAKKEKYYKIGNSMLDNLLRGIGVGGQAVLTVKNIGMDVYDKYQKSVAPDASYYDKQPDYAESAWHILDFSPPISIKARKLRQAAKNWEYNNWKHDKDPWSLDDPSWLSGAYVISALTNIPLDRLVKKMDNVRGAMESDQEWWKRVAMLSGWAEWELESTADRETRKQEEKIERRVFEGKQDPTKWTETEQKDILRQYKVSENMIKKLNTKEKRAKAIEKLKNKTNKTYTPSAVMLTPEYAELAKTNKDEQIKMLKDFKVSSSMISRLNNEDKRIRAIIKLRKKYK